MRDLTLRPVSQFRRHDVDVVKLWGDIGGPDDGAFEIPAGVRFDGYRSKAPLKVIASGGSKAGDWDHVSVSCRTRCPNWEEMMLVFRLFFKSDEVAVQYGMPKNQHICKHPYVLHWWRPHLVRIETPPVEFV